MNDQLEVYEGRLTQKSTFPGKRFFYLSNGKTIAEASPLPGYSRESADDIFAQLLLLSTNSLQSPLLPALEFATVCLTMPHKNLSGIPLASLIRSEQDLQRKSTAKKCKVKIKDLPVQSAASLCENSYRMTKAPLRIDCNRTWNKEKLLKFLSVFDPSKIEYIEEPAPTLEENRTIAHEASCDIALDESLVIRSLPEIEPHAPLFAFVLKPQLLGDIRPWLALPAKKHVLSSSYETGVGIRHLLNLKQLFSEIDGAVGCDTIDEIEDIFASPSLSLKNAFTEDIPWSLHLNTSLKKLPFTLHLKHLTEKLPPISTTNR